MRAKTGALKATSCLALGHQSASQALRVQVKRSDCTQCRRLDAQGLQARQLAARDVVNFHRVQIVTAHDGLAGRKLHQRRLNARQSVGQADYGLVMTAVLPSHLYQLLEGKNLRPTSFKGLPDGAVFFYAFDNCGGYVFNPHRLKPGCTACQRNKRKQFLQRSEGI